jgi:hypothetical protein
MAELQEAGDDVLITISQKEGQGIKEFGFLDPKSFGYGDPSLKSLPIKMNNTKYVCTAVLLRIQSSGM